jgi:hypothetical protein
MGNFPDRGDFAHGAALEFFLLSTTTGFLAEDVDTLSQERKQLSLRK